MRLADPSAQIDTTFRFKVETLEAGQRARHGDSHYCYRITDECDEEQPECKVRDFAQFLRPSFGDRFTFGEGDIFVPRFVSLERLAGRCWEYKVRTPSTH